MTSTHQSIFARPVLRRMIFAGLLIIVALGLRLPGLEKTIWNLDEASTFTMAEIVRDGGVLYRDAADNRTPLAPYAKALMFGAVGDWNIEAVHIVVAGMLGLTAILLWMIGRATKDEITGVWSAVYFTLLSFVFLTVGDTMAAHTGWFLIFFSSLGMWSFITAFYRKSPYLAIFSGVMFGFAALSKQPGLLDWGVCIVICLLACWNKLVQWRRYALLIGSLIAGFLIPMVITYAYFQANGAWDDFLRYAWNYNTQLYVPEVPPMERLLGIRVPFTLAWDNAPYALLLGVVGARWLLGKTIPTLLHRTNEFPLLPWLILGWTASGLASTILSGRDFAHYSIQILPGLSLACAWVSVRIWRGYPSWKPVTKRNLRIALALGFLSLPVKAIYRATHFDIDQGISRDIGQMIKAQTTPDDRIFVWGYEPELHVFSERLPSTRFIYAVFLTGLIPWTNVDPLKDTTYAIVTGAWDDFWTDFNRRPPTMFVDTYSNRGFLKYPLGRQKQLWEIIQQDYVEVTSELARSRGYKLYKRADPVDQIEHREALVSHQIKLSGPSEARPDTIRIRVQPPAKSNYITLMLDDRPYRKIASPPESDAQISFFVLKEDLPEGTHQFRAITEGKQLLISPKFEVEISSEFPEATVTGPAIDLDDRQISPFKVETLYDQSVITQTSKGYWRTDAPTSLSYRRPPELASIEFALQFQREAYDGSQTQNTDGVDVVVNFESDKGKKKSLYHRHLNPVGNREDTGIITAKVMLPHMDPGIVTLLITPGRMNIPAYDWIELLELKGEYSPFSLSFHGQQVRPLNLDAELGVDVIEYQERQVVLTHAPASFDIPQVAGIGEISGEFGFLDSAWQGEKKSAGAIFSVEQMRADGSTNLLFSQTLYPAENTADRTIHHFRVPVSAAAGAFLHFSTRPADPRNNAFNHTFWHGLRGWDFTAQIPCGHRLISSLSSEAPNGFAIMSEEGREVLFAHAPSLLVFPIPENAKQLSGKIGLLTRAYTGDSNSDGAAFIVEFEDTKGHRIVLFERLLTPYTIADDRGPQNFTIDVPAQSQGHLILRTATSPTGRLDFTWSYWQDLRFIP